MAVVEYLTFLYWKSTIELKKEKKNIYLLSNVSECKNPVIIRPKTIKL